MTTMHPVTSSNILSVGYDAERTSLVVTFKRERNEPATYTYPGVSLSVFEGMLSAESPGKYFNQYVMGLPFIKS